MKDKPVRGIYFGESVWVNRFMEKLRETECLCLNCENLKPEQPDNCPISKSLYEICVMENVALAVTRCPLWKQKKSK